MAIRVTHGRAEDIGKLGLEAGRAQGAVRNQALQLQADLASQEQQSRLQTAKISADTTIQRSVIDATNRKELAEFESFMRAESERRQIAWQVEKTESTQRHDFDMLLQRKDVENQLLIESEGRKQAEKQTQLDSLKKAFEENRIGETLYNDHRLKIELGYNSSGIYSSGDVGYAERTVDIEERRKAEHNRPEAVEGRRLEAVQKASDVLMQRANHRLIDDETREEAAALVKGSGVTLAAINQANQIIEAKIRQGIQQEKIKEQPFQPSQARLRTGGL